MYISIPVLALLGVGGYAFMNQSKFGKTPSGERKIKIENSPYFRNGQFQNLRDTPSFTEGANYFTVLKKFLFEKDKRSTPPQAIPTVQTDLKNLDIQEEVLVWFGHSSYYFQIDGKKILVDPVFSGHASPVAFSTRAFKGTNIFKAEDIPEIDFLFLTHDHWDHLDYDTLIKMKPKVKKIIKGLGTGEHLEAWGFHPDLIIEKDWNEEIVLADGFKVFTVPARHFSGRGFKRNDVLWTSFVLQTPTYKMFLGGDSLYDDHFKEIGNKFGPFDLVMLENGQYNKHWKYIHMMPDETLQAAKDLHAKKLLPVHNSKFALANHSWDAPLKTISNLHRNQFKLLTPRIGEKVYLKSEDQQFSRWWETIN